MERTNLALYSPVVLTAFDCNRPWFHIFMRFWLKNCQRPLRLPPESNSLFWVEAMEGQGFTD